MFFVEMTEQDMVDGMTNGYWVQAWTAFVRLPLLPPFGSLMQFKAAAKMIAKQEKTGTKLALVSSTLGYIAFLGWASYAPAKHALRGAPIAQCFIRPLTSFRSC